ncbi:MAG: YitT family protein [Lachnospiraceae bacterium]|nr:YitT family protein [Lachnospiraceae bacterium]
MKGANRLFWERNAMVIVGMLLFSMGINFFIVPAQLYNGGVLGISQIIRTILTTYLSLSFGGTDIAGIINLILNIPLFVLAYCSIGRNFFWRTVICVISQTIFLSVLPIPATPFVKDALTASMMGGILAGTGIGVALRFGGSSGGMDIVGMFFTKKYKNFSVGKVSLTVNAIVYGICAVLFGIPTAIYSIIYSAVSMLMTDRAHTQNINTEVMIFSKKEPKAILDYIVTQFKRDATWWEAKGGYTEGKTYMVLTVLSKYESEHLKRALKEIDDKAFVVAKEGMHVVGKYEKHL